MSTHYTAVLEVTKTEHREPGPTYRSEAGKPAERGVQEIARVVVRANSLAALQQKLTGHVELIDES